MPFQALAKLISDDILDSAQVQVFITDESFSEIKRGYQFSNSFVIYRRSIGKTKEARISIPAEMSPHVGNALLDELRVNEPELFRTGDTLEIDVSYGKGNVIVDIYASLDKKSIDTLKQQFSDAYCSSLIYDILFMYTPTYIHVRDKNTRDVKFVKTNRPRCNVHKCDVKVKPGRCKAAEELARLLRNHRALHVPAIAKCCRRRQTTLTQRRQWKTYYSNLYQNTFL